MTNTYMDLSEILQKYDQGDFLRTMPEAVLQLLLEADVEGLIGAGRHERASAISAVPLVGNNGGCRTHCCGPRKRYGPSRRRTGANSVVRDRASIDGCGGWCRFWVRCRAIQFRTFHSDDHMGFEKSAKLTPTKSMTCGRRTLDSSTFPSAI